ncbi:MAG: Surfeit locus 1 family protein [Sphingobium sp.]|nr:MAG: Surfeit locus 1 family protein [Sphingobium sp.]
MTSRRPASILIGAGAVGLTVILLALCVWQVERRAWKHALIAAVDARVHAPAVAAPPPAEWTDVRAGNAAYRHVTMTGRFLNDRETLVRATTERGSGYWVMTPLRTDGGWTVLVNRGFVPPEWKARTARAAALPAGEVRVTGLLRVSEPGGGFLRANDPAQDRWYSRDVAAISGRLGLGAVAPYFIDADATPNPGGYPVGGLTVIRFPDNHMVYALTWFVLALMTAWAAWRVLRPARSEA